MSEEADIYGEAPWLAYLMKHRLDEDTPHFLAEFTTLYLKSRNAMLAKAHSAGRREGLEEGAKVCDAEVVRIGGREALVAGICAAAIRSLIAPKGAK